MGILSIYKIEQFIISSVLYIFFLPRGSKRVLRGLYGNVSCFRGVKSFLSFFYTKDSQTPDFAFLMLK